MGGEGWGRTRLGVRLVPACSPSSCGPASFLPVFPVHTCSVYPALPRSRGSLPRAYSTTLFPPLPGNSQPPLASDRDPAATLSTVLIVAAACRNAIHGSDLCHDPAACPAHRSGRAPTHGASRRPLTRETGWLLTIEAALSRELHRLPRQGARTRHPPIGCRRCTPGFW